MAKALEFSTSISGDKPASMIVTLEGTSSLQAKPQYTLLEKVEPLMLTITWLGVVFV